jgi:hypothetical protein
MAKIIRINSCKQGCPYSWLSPCCSHPDGPADLLPETGIHPDCPLDDDTRVGELQITIRPLELDGDALLPQ